MMMATLLTTFLFATGQGGPYLLPLPAYETALSGCLEAWSTFTTMALALFMREQSQLGRASGTARGSSFWRRNRRALWTLTVVCIVYPLTLILLNVVLASWTKMVSYR